MRIAYVLARKDFFTQGRNGRVTHAKGIAESMVSQGCEINVYSGNGIIEHLQIPEDHLYQIQANSKLFFQLKLCKSLIKKREDYDFLIIRYSTLLGWFFCVFLNLFYSKKWCFEVNSFGFQQIKKNQMSRYINGLLQWFELTTIKFSNMISCVSDTLLSTIRPYNSNSFTIMNAAFHNDTFDKISTKEKIDGRIKLVYFGMFHSYYDLISVANEVVNQPDFELHLYGTGELEAELRRISKTCDRVVLHGRYKLENLISKGAFSELSFLILPYKAGTIANIGSPTKLFEYLALGFPIILSSVGQPYDILKSYKGKEVLIYQETISDVFPLIDYNHNYSRNKLMKFFRDNHTWATRSKEYIFQIQNRLNR